MSNPVASTNSTASKPPGHDIFCTPENSDFVSKVPYQSLSKTDHEIRLLKILPDSGSGFVECELLPAVSLANVQKQYLALSYCAGSAKNTKPIKVNGANSNVFSNLHHALTCARHYWETHAELPEFLLWVDQICINQFDLAERSHQVGFMRDIYLNANRTLICLSTEETDGEGMRWLAELKNMVGQGKVESLTCAIIEKSNSEEFAKGLASVCGIITSKWWGRAWIFQEFMVSTYATFLYGSYAMPHGDFSKLAIGSCWAIRRILLDEFSESMLRTQLEKSSHDEDSLWSSDSLLYILTAKLVEPTPTDLETLLYHTRDCLASDPRDRIYSVLGLANPGYGIIPDYSPENDVPKLLVETTTRIIAFEDKLSILSDLNRHRGSMEETRQLPSWVINWIDDYLLFPSYWTSTTNRRPKMGSFEDHKITAGSIDASFVEVPHPGHPGTRTTVLQLWAILLDTDFQAVGGHGDSKYTEDYSLRSYEGSQHYMIESYVPVESDQELWILCGACETFLLTRYSYGYRIFVPATIINAVVEDGVMKLPQFMDDQGIYDTNKMNWKRITLF
ncbi:heterokaryon incompatibility protein 6, or allele [Fusarium flagelliforme]|uniref:Heterokaryon incompatibility protein 6, or allele n=1 Tax=Fusarium flagelliforme TaxID=2675880 RepID=A0A395MT23_9HYPO|nr:heterokaryon incompatibility protein 6, or allele [Fusarium flagelliforme]